MEKIKKNTSPSAVILMIATYISFALAYSFGARTIVARYAGSIGFLSNVIVAAILGGIIPWLLFELGRRLYVRPLVSMVPNIEKSALRLRLFFIAGNLVTFALSFLYYAYPFLSVWGGILLNFLVLLVCLAVYLITEVKRMTDKSKAAYIVMQSGTIFLFLFTVATIARAILGII